MTFLSIVGSGPYGLSIAAAAADAGIDYKLYGVPYQFWKEHMPQDMFLRTPFGKINIDPAEKLTFPRFISEKAIAESDVTPVPIAHFFHYCDWFIETRRLTLSNKIVSSIERENSEFIVTTNCGTVDRSKKVIVAVGLKAFANYPVEITKHFDGVSLHHSCDFSNFSDLKGMRVLIIGGRQSAFESAALISEHGGTVHVVYRHPTPEFVESDWTFMVEMVQNLAKDPAWFMKLSDAEEKQWAHRAYLNARCCLSSWLGPRILRKEIILHPESTITSTNRLRDSAIQISLSSGQSIEVDCVILATGYKPNIRKLEFLKSLTNDLIVNGDSPVLQKDFQSSIPGLYFTGFIASKYFGYPFSFIRGAPTAANIFIRSLLST